MQVQENCLERVKAQVQQNLKHTSIKELHPLTHSHQKFTFTYHLASNICLPFHFCYSKALLQLGERHFHHQGVSCNHWFSEPHFVNPSKEKIILRPSHFWLQHNQATNLCHCLDRAAKQLSKLTSVRICENRI